MKDAPQMHQCSGCGAAVAARRPSKSGTHWCKASDCQAKKQAYYRNRNADREKQLRKDREATLTKRLEDTVDMVVVLASGVREQCPTCGLVDALPGFAHPDSSGGPCWGLGGHERAVSARVVPALWPEATRTYRKVR